MQPEPIQSSSEHTLHTNKDDTSNFCNHGLPILLDDESSRRKLAQSPIGTLDSGGPGGSYSEPATPHRALGRLSLYGNCEDDVEHKKPPLERISEYENALSPSARRQPKGPSFLVVETSGEHRNDETALEKFPNEVLTHILSHLPPAGLLSVSLVSHRFYSLVTTPHAWRIAFSRLFLGQDAIGSASDTSNGQAHQLNLEQRLFTRLTAFVSWRCEYIMRTRLLRSLERGKPSHIALGYGASARLNSAANNANAVVTYSSQLFSIVNHIDAQWDTGKKSPRFIHGADENGLACTSDPNIGRIDNWGLTDPNMTPQFADLFAGDTPYGLGNGPAGLPNSMAVSQPYGMIYGAGYPGGTAYYRATDEQRGRSLDSLSDFSELESGIPRIPNTMEAISAVWIAKSNALPSMTNGLIGLMSGSTLGVITAYSLGSDTARGRRIGRGQVTAKWVLCPGIPIIGMAIDESYNTRRKANGKIWVVALNALGEVYYLTDTITSTLLDIRGVDYDEARHPWSTARTAYWHLVEPSRRIAREDPYQDAGLHGSYSPRSSNSSMGLSKEQLVAETREIEKFLNYYPSHFTKICEGWDMRRRLEVDFAGDDEHGAGEAIVVVKCGIEVNDFSEIKRFTRCRHEEASLDEYPLPRTPPTTSPSTTMASLFGGGVLPSPSKSTSSCSSWSPLQSGSPKMKTNSSVGLYDDWRSTTLSLTDQSDVKITTTCIDNSIHALTTVDEDSLHHVNDPSKISSSYTSPFNAQAISATAYMPGQRARFLAVGTDTGKIIIFNMRGPQSNNSALVNDLQPLRIISTDSPSISCLAITALFVVHGGNDGLVQAWDVLASTLHPVRTLNSRFSSRARRRLMQAEASIHGVGINIYAAGTIVVDPDPTSLRGMVSLGTHLRYWSYSSSSADQYHSRKRRLRRSNQRGSNSGPDRYTGTGSLKDYIATEQEELRQDKARRAKHEAILQGRFGVGLGGLSEEETLRYAQLVSAESFQTEEERRNSDTGYLADTSPASSYSVLSTDATVTPDAGCITSMTPPSCKANAFEHDLEEAMRLSLLEGIDEDGRSPTTSNSSHHNIPITYKPKKSRRSPSSPPPPSHPSTSKPQAAFSGDDLDLALRLSVAETKMPSDLDKDFPKLGGSDDAAI